MAQGCANLAAMYGFAYGHPDFDLARACRLHSVGCCRCPRWPLLSQMSDVPLPAIVKIEIAVRQPQHAVARRRDGTEIANCRQLSRSLGARGDWPRGSAADRGEPRDEIPPFHSITSSARSTIDGGTARPSALAVLRLTTNSNLVANCTGSSLTFAPPSKRST